MGDGLLTMISTAGTMEKAILILLAIGSVALWSVVFLKIPELLGAKRNSKRFLERFHAVDSFSGLKAELDGEGKDCVHLRVFKAALAALDGKRVAAPPAAKRAEAPQFRIQPENQTEELIGGQGMQLRVALQHERDKAGAAAKLHDASDDIYYVLEGGATLVVGGRLDSPKEVEPGEWRGPRIIDGKTYEIAKGDLVIVPRGTPHGRSTENKDFTMILIKIYAEPLKKLR